MSPTVRVLVVDDDKTSWNSSRATDAERRASDIGADGYLAKPFDLEDLLETLARHRK